MIAGLKTNLPRRGLERCKGVQLGLVSFGLNGFSCGVLELVADIPLELLREANDYSQTSFTSCLTAPSL